MDLEESFSSDASFFLIPAEGTPAADTPPATKKAANLSRYFPKEFPWTYEHIQAAETARSEQPDGLLFIDNLLDLVGIDGRTHYPPRSSDGLSDLLDMLLASPHGLLKSHSIIFYLCLAASCISGSSSSTSSNFSSLPTTFARDYLLPTGYVRSIEGFHALDSRDFNSAVAALTDPHLTPDFVEKTIHILSTLPPDVRERPKLVLSYWELSGVEIGGEGEEAERMLGWILEALCDSERPLAFGRAWGMMRGWNDEEGRTRLAEKILVRCFGDNPFKRPLTSHLHSLLAAPLSPNETTLLHSFCLSSPATLSTPHATLAADFLLSKYIAGGQLLQAMKAGREIEEIGRVPGQERRGRLLRGVRETLTEVQKMSVDLEGEIAIGPVVPSISTGVNGASSLSKTVTQPAWMPVPSVTATAISNSTPLKKSITRPVITTPALPSLAVADLPLSASPFLRREKQLVGTKDGMPGSSSGGAQKTLLRAMMDSGAGKEFGNGGGAFLSDATQKEKERKVTLKGFGSIRRTPSFSTNPMSGGSERSWGGRSGTGTVERAIPRRMEVQADDKDDDGDDPMQLRSPSPPLPTPQPAPRRVSSKAAPTQSFAIRAAQDPAIASAIASAASADSPPSSDNTTSTAPAAKLSKSKRRTFSTQHSEVEGEGDKRRAVSVEPADSRPTSALQVAAGRLPGAFPGAEEEARAEVESTKTGAGGRKTGRRTTATKGSTVAEKEETKSRRKTTAASSTPAPAPIRRSARASSVVPASPAPVTPRAKPRAAANGVANDTPRTSAIRRSARLGTPVPVTRSSRRDVVTTDEETGEE